MIAVVVKPQAAKLLDGIVEALRSRGITPPCHIVQTLDEAPGLADTEILLSGGVPVGDAEMDRLPKLRAIVSPVLGYDWVDVEAATRRNILVLNGDVAENREGMAEATIMLLLALLYRLQATEGALRGGTSADLVKRRMLKASTVGIIGFGGITRAMIERLANWGCDFLVTSRGSPEAMPNVRFVGLTELLENSDSIVVLTSLDPGTRKLLGREEFARIKPGAVLVNTARGGIIDEDALIDALKDGRLAAAALDVFEVEPLPPAHPLRDLPNLILTPHAIGHNEQALRAIPRVAAENIVALLDHRVPASCRNPHAAKAAPTT